MNLQLLKTEIDTDPLARGYAGMTDAQVATDINTTYRTRNRDSMTGDEVFQATDSAQWDGLTDSQKNQWLAVCGRDSIDPFASANVALVQALFGAGATTTNLQALRIESGVSRAAEIGLPIVNSDDVGSARAL